MTLICSFQLNCVSIYTPRNFVVKTVLIFTPDNAIPPAISTVFGWKITKLVLIDLKIIVYNESLTKFA